MPSTDNTVVLVHGAFVDGSGWRAVHDELTRDGYRVRIVQNPTNSLAEDAAATRAVLDELDGPAVLVGHSYGGAVITEAGVHEAVSALVYITAFAPDKGESVNSLLGTFPQDGPQPPILPSPDGHLLLDRAKFHAAFAADLSPEDAAFLAHSQTPWGLEAIGGTISEAAWRLKPSWYLHVTEDRMIPPAAQRSMAERLDATVRETAGSHAIYVSRPTVVADLIRAAAQ
ncbi:alpha/beta fold hydrolase [Nocardia huaxiensis]|uniref:alpha/beta fold hydrolase n=1 Tax=Nocardia huaxiensis TaxID=2755382 RepID=UPI001E504CC8|nr:alpha/beta hydrolase [Nocardia huaxiensis]UFS97503.1 alpha/beta hydrolase [Nocardia huaxiensis]